MPSITEEWFVGFVDGEGSFSVRVDRPTGVNAGSRQVHVRLEVNQALRDAAVIEQIRDFFGFGRVDYNTSEGQICQWRVLRQADIEHLVEVFDRIPLRTIKRFDYAIWRSAVTTKARLQGGMRGRRGVNEPVWSELERLAAELRALRQSRRADAALLRRVPDR